MANIQITIDSAQLEALLSHLNDKADHLEPVLAAVAHDITSRVHLCFKDSKTPYGEKWKQLSPVTIGRRRQGSHVPLQDTGRLKNSISYRVSGNSAEIGTNVVYAAMMNFGGKKSAYKHLWGDIPARQFMPTGGLPDDWQRSAIGIINRHLGIIQ